MVLKHFNIMFQIRYLFSLCSYTWQVVLEPTSPIFELYYSDPSIREDVDKVVSYYDDEANLPDYPIALLPAHIDVRIISQKSVFTIHGKRHGGFLDICKEHGDARIMKLRINGRKAKSIRQELITLCINETSLTEEEGDVGSKAF